MSKRWIPNVEGRNKLRPNTTPEDPSRAEALRKNVEMIERQRPAGEQRQLGKAIRAARSAAANAVHELSGHKRMGYRLPETDDLVSRFGTDLPGSARRELRAFIAEVRPRIEEGSQGLADEAARNFGLEVGEAMVEAGWAPDWRAEG